MRQENLREMSYYHHEPGQAIPVYTTYCLSPCTIIWFILFPLSMVNDAHTLHLYKPSKASYLRMPLKQKLQLFELIHYTAAPSRTVEHQ